MNRARDGHDRLTFSEQLVTIRFIHNLARIGQASLNCFVLLQASYILGRADDRGDHRTAEGGRADILHSDAVAGFVQALEITAKLAPVDKRPIVAGSEAEYGPGRRNVAGL